MASTRLRITEAAVDLHGSIGPARTTITAVAERAGVQRHTVYSHFPTDADLFAACSTHFFGGHPWPDPGVWRGIDDPVRRLTRALGELYAYYETTEAMLANALRDEALVPTVVPVLRHDSGLPRRGGARSLRRLRGARPAAARPGRRDAARRRFRRPGVRSPATEAWPGRRRSTGMAMVRARRRASQSGRRVGRSDVRRDGSNGAAPGLRRPRRGYRAGMT